MLKALRSGSAGLNAQQLRVDVLANNMANVNTTGFKKSRADFSELVNQELLNSRIPVARSANSAKTGSGVRVAQIIEVYSQGNIIETGRPLDLAVQGEGYFKVLLPDGEERYTRNGSFSPDQEGNLVTPSGQILEGIQLKPGSDKVIVSPDGSVKCEKSGSFTNAGRITLHKFSNMNGLRVSGESLFSFDETAGEVISGVPGSTGFGTVRRGCLEMANVDTVEEMAGLMEAQRAYGLNARAVRTVDDMWGVANNMRK